MRLKCMDPLCFPLRPGWCHTRSVEFPGPHSNSYCTSPAPHVSFLRTKENLGIAMLVALMPKLTFLYLASHIFFTTYL